VTGRASSLVGPFKESRHFWLEDSPGQKWRDHEKTNEGTDVFAALVNLPVNEKPLAQRRPAAAAA
jgi:hypothetical protein